MVNLGVYVSIKAILVRRSRHPKGDGHIFHQVDFHDGLDALKTVLPRHNQACRRAVHDERMEVIRELEARQEARDQQLRDDWLEN